MYFTSIEQNKNAIIAGLKWLSIIFTSVFCLLIITLYLVGTPLPNYKIIILILLCVSIIMPIVCISFPLLKWKWDMYVTRRNFASKPFNQLEEIGFKKKTLHEGSRTSFISECYSGIIEDFRVVGLVETQYENEYINFHFYINETQYHTIDFKNLKANEARYNYNSISKKYHFKKHQHSSIEDLKFDLEQFALFIKLEKFIPFDFEGKE